MHRSSTWRRVCLITISSAFWDFDSERIIFSWTKSLPRQPGRQTKIIALSTNIIGTSYAPALTQFQSYPDYCPPRMLSCFPPSRDFWLRVPSSGLVLPPVKFQSLWSVHNIGLGYENQPEDAYGGRTDMALTVMDNRATAARLVDHQIPASTVSDAPKSSDRQSKQ
ncbi:hypothetical protein M758_1G213000 [Ceratodon purpureus]|nr:hypothetical protein M758_1G213000 [Ceratodon purpureus]